MNDGVYALPGFMPPAAAKWKSQLRTNEDGSIKLCVYCGEKDTNVYYALDIPGWRFGFIKDAQYFIDNNYPQWVIDTVKDYVNYLSEVSSLPEDAVVPNAIFNGYPIPITELPVTGSKSYWIIDLPKYVLPVGDTKISISAGGRIFKYVVHRPEFSIHKHPDITKKSF